MKKSENKKIFIGGTGRSGTTILSKWLGSHKEIHNIPVESRFIIDKGGMIDLFYALTINYSLDQSRIVLRDFYDLMINQLTNPFNAPYLKQDFNYIFGKDFYLQEFNSFFNKLVESSFTASDFHSPESYRTIRYIARKYVPFLDKKIELFNKSYRIPLYLRQKEEMLVGKYFTDQEELLQLMGNFINCLFSKIAQENNKKHWCEDTPANVLHLDYLSRLFDNGYFIHIVRHPIGVAYSMKKQFFGPNDYETIAKMLKNLYEKLIFTEKYAQKHNISFLEIKLEELDEKPTQKKVTAFLDIDHDFDGSIQLERKKVTYYKELMPDKEYKYLKDHLSRYINHYQYD